MQAYLDQLQHILDTGVQRPDRTGVGTLSAFGLQARYAMADGFPAVTTKKLAFKTMVSELLWFISGSSNINDLKAIYSHNHIWDANYEDYLLRLGLDGSVPGNAKAIDSAHNETTHSHSARQDSSHNDPARQRAARTGAFHHSATEKSTTSNGTFEHGDMGRVYGVQWRRWQAPDGRQIDQLDEAVQLIKHNPESRRILVNAWNPAEISATAVALPPCHTFFQFFVSEGKLSLQMYQRSADMFLGVPFNIASYALLLHLVARVTGLVAHEFIHTIGDAHIYLDAIDQVQEQLQRQPLPLPQLHIEDRGQSSVDDFLMADFALVNYQCHAPIKAKMAV